MTFVPGDMNEKVGSRKLGDADIDLTDLNPVIAKLRVRLLKVNKKKAPKLFDFAKLENAQVKAEFTSELEEKFQALYAAYDDRSPIEAKWSGIQGALTETAEAVLNTRFGTKEECISDETFTLITENKTLKVKMESV